MLNLLRSLSLLSRMQARDVLDRFIATCSGEQDTDLLTEGLFLRCQALRMKLRITFQQQQQQQQQVPRMAACRLPVNMCMCGCAVSDRRSAQGGSRVPPGCSSMADGQVCALVLPLCPCNL